MKKRRGLSRMLDVELARIAAVLFDAIDHWSDDDDQTADEQWLERAYDAVSMEGERRFGSTDFAAIRDAELKHIGRVERHAPRL